MSHCSARYSYINTLSVYQDESFIFLEVGGADRECLSEMIALPRLAGRFLVFLHILRGSAGPWGAQGVVESDAQLATRIIHFLHLFCSTSHFSSFYSSPF